MSHASKDPNYQAITSLSIAAAPLLRRRPLPLIQRTSKPTHTPHSTLEQPLLSPQPMAKPC